MTVRSHGPPTAPASSALDRAQRQLQQTGTISDATVRKLNTGFQNASSARRIAGSVAALAYRCAAPSNLQLT
jgi:hypothetical protein